MIQRIFYQPKTIDTMSDRDSELQMTTTATFSFASGHILTLDEHQIEQIPYLYAMVSSADRFESARNENGHFKLHPHIDYEHFSFVLHSLSFCSVRQLFTCLPKYIDVIPLIALLDFLGLGPQPDPPLNEVNSTFFSTIVYSPLLEKHLQIVRPCVLQEIAVRFGIAMAKEEYDLTKCEVVDQIYWFVMFILSAHKWFGSRLRHHIYIIAEHCFSLFKPSLLKPLKKLKERAEEERRRFVVITDQHDCGSDEENSSVLEQTLDLDSDLHIWHRPWSYYPSSFWYSKAPETLKTRRDLLNRTYNRDESRVSWFWEISPKKDVLEPVYKRVLEIAYERLQTAISEAATAELSQGKNRCESLVTMSDLWFLFDCLERETLPKRIDHIFTDESVKEEIRALILEELSIFTPKLKPKHAKLLEEIRKYEQDWEASLENNLDELIIFRALYDFQLSKMQDVASSYEVLLDKLYHNSQIIVEEMQRRVLDGLRKVTLKQFDKWEKTRQVINELHRQLHLCEELEKPPSIASKRKRHRCQIPLHKPLLNRQFKHSAR